MKNHPFSARLRFAANGIRTLFQAERSFRTQAAAMACAFAALALLGSPPVWWAIVGLAGAHVLAMEAMNSALEYLADHLHPGRHAAIGRAKDAAAGAVLIASIVALAVALLLLADRLVR